MDERRTDLIEGRNAVNEAVYGVGAAEIHLVDESELAVEAIAHLPYPAAFGQTDAHVKTLVMIQHLFRIIIMFIHKIFLETSVGKPAERQFRFQSEAGPNLHIVKSSEPYLRYRARIVGYDQTAGTQLFIEQWKRTFSAAYRQSEPPVIYISISLLNKKVGIHPHRTDQVKPGLKSPVVPELILQIHAATQIRAIVNRRKPELIGNHPKWRVISRMAIARRLDKSLYSQVLLGYSRCARPQARNENHT